VNTLRSILKKYLKGKRRTDMQVHAKEVIGFVSGNMGITGEAAQRALCITDREMVVELECGRQRTLPAYPEI
jgi:hypothetical protein